MLVRKYEDEENNILSEDYITYTFDGEKFVRSCRED